VTEPSISYSSLPTQSVFFDMTCGQNFLCVSASKAIHHAVIILPPFAEEMNKSRHIFKQLLTELAQHQYYGFMLDNYGTGDSEADLDLATISLWRDDLQLLLQHLAHWRFSSVSFIALRFGALQLFDLLNHVKLPLPIKQVVLWQPMFDPKRFWQQFCRIKIAEAMANGDKVNQTQIEQQLVEGQVVEIAGYPINLAFYQSIQQIDSSLPVILTRVALSWFELSKLDTLAVPVQKMHDNLEKKCQLNFQQIKAEAFWQTTELATADQLIHLTLQQFVETQ
jgi:exosortase A-associated hydrolase 2